MGFHLGVCYEIEGPHHFEEDPANWAAISLLAPHSSKLVLEMSPRVDIVGSVGSIQMKLVGICLPVAPVVVRWAHCTVVSAGTWGSWHELTYFGRAGKPRDCLDDCELP